MENQRYTLDISTGTILRFVTIGIALTLLFFLWKIVAGLFLAIIIAATVEPAIQFFGRHHIPRPLSVGAIYGLGILALGGLFYLVFPNLFFEFRDFSATFPDRYAEFIHSFNQTVGAFGAFSLPEVDGSGLGNFFENIRNQTGLGASDFFSFIVAAAGGVLAAVFVFVISFYLSLEESGIEKFLRSLIPQSHHEYAFDLWRRIKGKLSKWVRAQLILMLFVGFVMFPVLWALGVKYALSLAILVALFEVIPVIGPIVAGTLLFFFILIQSPTLAIIAFGVYVLLQQIQAHLIVPAVVSRALGLNPVVIILLLVVGGSLGGLWGAVLAIPFGAVINELLGDIRVS